MLLLAAFQDLGHSFSLCGQTAQPANNPNSKEINVAQIAGKYVQPICSPECFWCYFMLD